MLGILLRLVLAVAFGLATFWPDYGLLWQAMGWFETYPLAVIAGGCLWTIIMSLLLPLEREMFQAVSALALAAAIGVGFYWMHTSGLVDATGQNFWLTWGVGAVFFIIGWLMIATRIWRATHSVTPVDDGDE